MKIVKWLTVLFVLISFLTSHISMQNNIEKEAIVEVLTDVIENEFCEYLNLMDENIRVDVDEDFNMQINLSIHFTIFTD